MTLDVERTPARELSPDLFPVLRDLQVPLAPLLSLPPAQRHKLLQAAATRSLSGMETLEHAELTWLLDRPGLRQAVLRQASREQIRDLLRQEVLTSGDLEVLDGKLPKGSSEFSTLAASILTKTKELALFRQLFGDYATGLELFLSPPAQEFWRHCLHPDAETCPSEVVEETIEEINAMAMFKLLSLPVLARFIRIPGMRRIFGRRLVDQGLVQEVADALLGRAAIQPVNALPPADLEPAIGWVRALDAVPVARAGSQLAFGPWASWWQRLVSLHPKLGPVDPANPPTRGTIVAGWWLAGASAAGELELGAFLRTVLAWLPDADPETKASLPAIIRAAGGTPEYFKLLSKKDPPTFEAASEHLAWLHDQGLTDSSSFCQGVPLPRLGLLASAAGEDTSFIALVDLASPGPLTPPTAGVRQEFLGWLPILAGTSEFWSRWQDGVPPAVLDWLALQLGSHPASQYVSALQGAIQGQTNLLPAQLPLLAGALPIGTLCRHLVLAATQNRETDAESLLSARAFCQRQPLQEWLRVRLWRWFDHPSPLPEMTSSELEGLAPLLDLRELVAASEHSQPLSKRLRAEIESRQRSTVVPGFSPPPPAFSKHRTTSV